MRNKDEKVSIIVPVYNVEKYLDRCIDSLVNQTYSNIEIILVDDKSPDNCPRICDEWALKDSRIVVVHKEINQGLGYARNSGLEVYSGDYVCFCDSDDYLDLTAIEQLLTVMHRDSSDLVFFGHRDVDVNGEIIKSRIPHLPQNVYEDDEILNYFLPTLIFKDPIEKIKRNITLSSCMIMYAASVINNIQWRFVSERDYISEDYYSLLVLMKSVRKISILEEALYNYTYNNASLSRKYDENRIRKNNSCYEAMVRVCEGQNYPDIVKKSVASLYLNNVIAALKALITVENKKDQNRVIKEFMTDSIATHAIGNIDITLENRFRKLFIFAYNIKSVVLLKVILRLSIKKSKRTY